MHIIIKGAKTIEEYKQRYLLMQGLAEEFHTKCGNGQNSKLHGEIRDVWMDEDGNLYLSYEDSFSGMFAKRKKGVGKGWKKGDYLLQ